MEVPNEAAPTLTGRPKSFSDHNFSTPAATITIHTLQAQPAQQQQQPPPALLMKISLLVNILLKISPSRVKNYISIAALKYKCTLNGLLYSIYITKDVSQLHYYYIVTNAVNMFVLSRNW